MASKVSRRVLDKFLMGEPLNGGNFYSDGKILYSYGPHFPLAVHVRRQHNYLPDRQLRKGWILLNGDRYSSSTTEHQSMTFQAMGDQPRISFSALDGAILRLTGNRRDSMRRSLSSSLIQSITNQIDLIDMRKDTFEKKYLRGYQPDWMSDDSPEVLSQEDLNKYYESLPLWGTRSRWSESKRAILEEVKDRVSYHLIGGALLRFRPENAKPRYLLSGIDHGSYFMCEIPGQPRTMNQAFDALKPARIRAWEQEHGASAPRQGEWFFLPVEKESLPFRPQDMMRGKVRLLTRRQLDQAIARVKEADGRIPVGYHELADRIQALRAVPGNRHMASWAGYHGSRLFVSGRVSHWWPDLNQQTRQHPTMDFGPAGTRFAQAVINRAIGSWSGESVGGVD
jgi:hypothetical protein